MGSILIVDDEPGLRGMLEVVLRRDGHRVATAGDGREALSLINADGRIELVLTDLRMEGMDGLALLGELRAKHPDIFVVVMTAFAEWDTAVRAMRMGAYNFIRKPFDNSALKILVRRALAAREHRLAAKAAGDAGNAGPIHLVGSSPGIQAIQALVEQVSTTDSTVLVTGESGSGKELVARAIHYASMRSDGPLVRVNAAALTPSLLESELFGHVKGAFTGAIDDRPGLFTLADRGTLFLDEIGELTQETQAKLLRVLENGEYIPVGGREVRTCDVRLVAATNRDLLAMVKAGSFREDFYYRLAVIPVHLPPLRERKDDIALIAGHLLARHAVKLRRGVTGFQSDALQAMQAYGWPGNIRELDNRIQRGVALTQEGDISAAALFGEPGSSSQLPAVQAAAAAAQSGASGQGAASAHGAATAQGTAGRGTATTAARLDAGGNVSGAVSGIVEQLAARLRNDQVIDLEDELIRLERLLVEAALEQTGDNLTEAAGRLSVSFRQIRYKVRQLGLR